ncbi:MAG: cell envelope integrity protein TolA [Gammaproteobacteria bacterium]|nr:cell envelope integrity protein TolA [Gammaproteobacteria bacterium]
MQGPSKLAWSFSASLHAGLVVLMFFGPSLRPTPRQELPTGITMEATVIDAATLKLAKIPVTEPNMQKMIDERREIDRREQAARDKAEQELAEMQRQRKQADEQAALEQARPEKEKLAQEQARREEKQRQEQLAEQQRSKALAEQKAAENKAAEQKAQREEQRRQQALAEKKAAEAKAAKEKAELEEQQRLAKIAEKKAAERKKKEAATRARKAALEKKLREEQAARERELLAAMGVEEKRSNAVNSGLLAQYQAEIIAKVTRNWIRPPSAREELVCIVRAAQIPGGEVVSVTVMECNGDDAVERSIETAVRKSSPLPEPPDPTLFEREIIFTFSPK